MRSSLAVDERVEVEDRRVRCAQVVCQIPCFSLLLALTCCLPARAAEQRGDDRRSLSRLFGDRVAFDTLEVYGNAWIMAPKQRYEYLLNHVLPPDSSQVRLTIDYLPTNPSPPVTEKYGTGDLPLIFQSFETRRPSGGGLVSPAIQLVEVAADLGRLDDVEALVRQRRPGDGELRKAHTALLTLIARQTNNVNESGRLLAELTGWVRQFPVTDPLRAPEMAVIWQEAYRTETLSELYDLLFLLYEQVKADRNFHDEVTTRHVFSLRHYFDERLARRESADDDRDSRKPLSHWHPVSRMTLETRGPGYPNASWLTETGRARHLTVHSHDYLYYDVPLRGDFQIEGDLSTFNYRSVHLALGGIWAGPFYSLTECDAGDFHADWERRKLSPPISKIRHFRRSRLEVEDGVRTTYCNGRKLFTCQHNSANDPWVSLHCSTLTSGDVRDLRITGNPIIPDEIDLLAAEELPGWMPYYDVTDGKTDDSWHLAGGEPNVLIGRYRPEIRGSYRESLFYYHRPMLEDGVIQYEFYYEAGRAAVYPVLDRCSFLFEREQAGIHWLTDGPFDRTGLAPENFTRSEVAHAPLIDGTWNQARLTLTGDTVEIALNGEAILSRELEPENLRTFGLFHYSDQTEARVRNLRWRGGWPKELPALEQQEMADLSLEQELAEGPGLPLLFEHDFSTGLGDLIWDTIHPREGSVEQTSDGLILTKRSGGSYRHSVYLPFGLEGDFDAEIQFSEFVSKVAQNGEGNFHLSVFVDDEHLTECRFYRTRRNDRGNSNSQTVRAALFQEANADARHGFHNTPAEESSAGSLRLVRKGADVFFLFRSERSPHYQLIDRQTVSADPVRIGGLRLGLGTLKEGYTRVKLQKITVRAESAPGLINVPRPAMKTLDEQLENLQDSVEYRFDDELDLEPLFYNGDRAFISRDPEGWKITQPGFDNWRGTEIAPRVSLEGDFDLKLDLDVLKLEQSGRNGESTILLRVGFGAASPQSLEVKFSNSPSGLKTVEMQLNSIAKNGVRKYEECFSRKVDQVSQLRIARLNGITYLIYRKTPESKSQILAQVNVGNRPVPFRKIQALVHTGGAGRETIVRFKSMKIHAAEISE